MRLAFLNKLQVRHTGLASLGQQVHKAPQVGKVQPVRVSRLQ